MIVEKIYQYLSVQEKTLNDAILDEVAQNSRFAFKRQFMEADQNDKGKLRLSSAGRCARQVAYAYHGFEKKGKEIDARAKLVFWTGDLIELTVVNLAKLSGCVLLNTGQDQLTVSLPVNGTFAVGHPDGIYEDEEAIDESGNSTNGRAGKRYLLEVKSMSSFSYEKFEKGEIDEGYISQINAYMSALNLDSCVFIGLNKDNGMLHERIVKKNPKVVESLTNNLASVAHSTPEKLPPPPAELEANEKGIYPWNCLYCAYWMHCRKGAEKVLVGKSYKLKKGE